MNEENIRTQESTRAQETKRDQENTCASCKLDCKPSMLFTVEGFHAVHVPAFICVECLHANEITYVKKA